MVRVIGGDPVRGEGSGLDVATGGGSGGSLDRGHRRRWSVERADSDEFAVRHVDDVHQPEDDRQTRARTSMRMLINVTALRAIGTARSTGCISGEIAMQNLNFMVSSHPNKSIAEVSKDTTRGW